MITEDYCSFEVSKLLKEKGFDEFCLTSYNAFLPNHKVEESKVSEWGKANQIYRPTQQMAMKWLREEKNILLYVYPVINLPVKDDYTLFHWRWDGKKKIHAAPHFGDKHHNYESYEEAVEAAIKYSLENLI